jgi:hypothetical protein
MKTIRQFLLDGTVAIAAMTASLFVLGWSYLFGYYDYFDLDIQTLDLPTFTSLVSSVMPVTHILIKRQFGVRIRLLQQVGIVPPA